LSRFVSSSVRPPSPSPSLLSFVFRLLLEFAFRSRLYLSLDFPFVEAFCHQLHSATKTRDFSIDKGVNTCEQLGAREEVNVRGWK
jgi:hypothetical protein